MDASWNPKVMLRVPQLLVSRLRAMKDGEMVVVPAGWSATSSSSGSAVGAFDGGGGAAGGVASDQQRQDAILLSVRRRSAALWDLAVCTVDAGVIRVAIETGRERNETRALGDTLGGR